MYGWSDGGGAADERFMMRSPVLTAAAGGLVLLTSGPVWGQSPKADAAATYPGRPIRLVVPVPPGGSSDGMARILAQKLTDAWGQQVLVDNRPGAAEVIGTDIVAKSTADGHTLVLVSLRYSVNPSLLKLPYDTVKDFEPVTMTAAVGNVLVVNVKTPINSVQELIALAKQKPAELTFASSGLGGAPHLIGEFFALTTGVKLTHIAYKGGGPAITDLLGGNVSMSFASMTSSLPFIRSARLRALAVSSKDRSSQLPDVPTMAEAGVPGFDISTWFGLLAPAGTPADVIARWNADVTRILNTSDMRERLIAQGAEAAPDTPAEFARFIADELARYARIVKASGAKVD